MVAAAVEPSRAVLVLVTDDRAALLGQIAERFRPLALRVALRWGNGDEQVEDVVQDAFVRLMHDRNLPTEEHRQRAAVLLHLKRCWLERQSAATAEKRDVRRTERLGYAAPGFRDDTTGAQPSAINDDYDGLFWSGELAINAVRTAADEAMLRECLSVLEDGLGELTDEERAALAKRLEIDRGQTPNAVVEARRKLRERLAQAGYPRHDSGLPPYPRNRTVQMAEYRAKRKQERG